MKKHLITLLLLGFFSYNSLAQSVEKNLLKLDFVLPGITYEQRISNSTTAVINPLLGFSFGWLESSELFSITPNVNLEFRYYYNLERRVKLNKNILNNSANFLAPRIILAFPSVFSNYNDNSNFGVGFGGVYGIQRTFKSGIYILGEGGIGFGGKEIELFPILTFKIGYVFGEKKKQQNKD